MPTGQNSMSELATVQTPPDFGPIYTETDLSRFPAEPFNTLSNLVFLAVVVYFARQTRLDVRRHPFLVIALPVLFIGFVGGTIFHATRSDRMWLMMDWLPIFVLSLVASVYFWTKVIGRFLMGLGVAALAIITARAAMTWPLPSLAFKIAVGYGILAALILVPAAILCLRRRGRNARLLLGAAGFFTLALWCRSIDRDLGAVLPMGTHFIWHLCGGTAVFLLMRYIYEETERELIGGIDG